MQKKVPSPINSDALIALCYRDKSFMSAMKLARKVYAKDKRADQKTQFLAHPMVVTSLLLEQPDLPVAVAVAAMLQDTVSRGKVKEPTIRSEFGDKVADMVGALTPVRAGDGRIDPVAYGMHLSAAGVDVQNIKLASMLHDIVEVPFAKRAASFEMFERYQALLPFLAKGREDLQRRVQMALLRARA